MVVGSILSNDTAWLFLRLGLSLSSKLFWDVTTTQVNSALHPSRVTKSSTSFNWGKGSKVSAAGWQVTLCDPIRHVIPIAVWWSSIVKRYTVGGAIS